MLVDEDLHDRAFLDRCCVGADASTRYVLGDADGEPKTPEWAEAISGVAGRDDPRPRAADGRRGAR